MKICRISINIYIYLCCFNTLFATSYQLNQNINQAIVGISDDWNSSYVSLGLYEKKGGKWTLIGEFWRGRLGKNGSIWGLGLSPLQKGETRIKKEGDGKSPAGVFKIGGAWGYEKNIKKYDSLAYKMVTSKSLWVEDSNSRYYNKPLVLSSQPKTEWEKKQQMRQNDHAHSLKLFIHHNSPEKGNPLPNYGSAIFFHIWRSNGKKATSGCTTMNEDKLKELIAKIDPEKNPVYILLPRKVYLEKRQQWQLP